MTFQDLGLSEPIVRAVSAEGYETATPIQEQAIPHLLEGRDLLGCAQTGTGKTAAFALPILHRLSAVPLGKGRGRRIRALILSPTRELASQITQSIRIYGKNTPIRQTTIYGGVSQHAQVRAIRQGVDILVATPGRLLDLINQGFIDLRDIETFVLDEADRMFDMGFLPDLRRIISYLPNDRQTVLFSATMPSAVEQLATAILREPIQIRLATKTSTNHLIEQQICFVPQNHKIDILTQFLQDESIGSAVVFTRTKNGADKVVKRLLDSNVQAKAIHGDKSQNARERALASFKQNRTKVLVATDVASRGIDVSGISHVFNFDLPEEPESYVHRIGRTGRAGATGVAISFCSGHEKRLLREIERFIKKSIPIHPEYTAQRLAEYMAEMDDRGMGGGPRRPHARPPRRPHSLESLQQDRPQVAERKFKKKPGHVRSEVMTARPGKKRRRSFSLARSSD